MNDERMIDSKGRFSVETYQNNREQGYTIHNYDDHDNTFYICVSRNSDRLTVYQGTYAMQGISEDAYKNSTGFKFDLHAVCAEYVIQELLKTQAVIEDMAKETGV